MKSDQQNKEATKNKRKSSEKSNLKKKAEMKYASQSMLKAKMLNKTSRHSPSVPGIN